MGSIEEQFPGNLVRVIRDVKRKLKGGKTVSYKRSFQVRQSQPGDKYQQKVPKGNAVPVAGKPAGPIRSVGGEAPQDNPKGGKKKEEPVFRIAVQILGIPWAPDKEMSKKEPDPIPAAIRKKYDPKNRAMRASGPIEQESPLNTVVSADPVLWGADEVAVLSRMRSGRFSRLRVHPGGSGTIIATIETVGDFQERVYLNVDALTSPWVFQTWGDLYDLRRGYGDVCKRATASYEVAKGIGLDDLYPPTVVRHDDVEAFSSILPDDLMERSRVYNESLGRRTGENPGRLRRKIKGFSSAQMHVKETWTVVSEDWMHSLFSNEDQTDEVDILNNIYSFLPESRRVAFLRAAALDFVVWTADRHLGDVLFSDHDFHPMALMASSVAMPNPAKLAMVALGGNESFVHPSDGGAYPVLWSDFLIMLASRGTDEELKDFELLGQDIAGRMRKDRMVEVGRSMTEHGVPGLNAAAVLVRAKMLGIAAKKLARNPILSALHFAHLIGDDDPGLMESRDSDKILKEVNEAMDMVVGGDFDFVSLLRKKQEKQEGQE